ncbi:1-deoxy-D-xylulose-5-phosphate synthase N-terminal domain-containing protein [Nocardia sp. CWNU-33]|uniref:1-deoxy-D-xylulose-5-phosphate synthase N-terminal domain-containing protein n=1 Tax=Nocardia sp. CWNU-33 TaxID=3392117 RepID=UPI00398EE47C
MTAQVPIAAASSAAVLGPGALAHFWQPDDVRQMPPVLLAALARQVRRLVIDIVTAVGGQLGSNLGVVEPAIRHRLVITVQDGARAGGVQTALTEANSETNSTTKSFGIGLPARCLPHGRRRDTPAESGLAADGIVDAVLRACAAHSSRNQEARG